LSYFDPFLILRLCPILCVRREKALVHSG
jgi:hypothetical protein